MASLISSAANPQFKRWLGLLKAKGIRDAQEALIFGAKITREMAATLKGRGRPGVLGLIHAAGAAGAAAANDGAFAGIERWPVAADLFAKLDLFGTEAPLLWVKIPEFGAADAFTVVPGEIGLVLPFQNPDNVGALLRSAAAFGVRRVLLTAECAHPFHPKSVRAASGTLLHFRYFQGPPLSELHCEPGTAIGLSADGERIDRCAWPGGGWLVPGVEGPGLPAALAARLKVVSIPMAPGVESLNGMVATSLALYEWRKALGALAST